MSYSSEVLSDSPLAYWRLGETTATTTMADSSGNGHSGTYNNLASGTTVAGLLTGDSDTAYGPDGTTAHSDVTYAAWLDTPTAFTVEAWIKTSLTGVRSILDRDHNSSRVWQFRLNGGNLEFIKISGSVVGSATTGLSLNDNARHHVVATYDGSNIRLYTDGSLRVTTAAAGSLTGSDGLSIACNNSSGPTQLFGGTIDEAAVYGSVLSGTRISAHYTTGASLGATLSMTSPKVTSTISADYTAPISASLMLADAVVTGAISATFAAPVDASLDLTGLNPTTGISATYDPAPIEATLSGSLPMPSLSITASKRVFVPPTTTESSDDHFWGRYGIPVGQSVVLTDGHYVTTPYPWLGEIADLEEGVGWFQGGRTYDIDSPTASALQADGYTLTEV